MNHRCLHCNPDALRVLHISNGLLILVALERVWDKELIEARIVHRRHPHE